MAAQNLVLVTRTDNGKQLKISTTKIIEFKDQSGDTLITYVDQRGKIDHRLVTEAASAINTLTGGRTQLVTLRNTLATPIYINSDRIIYIDVMTVGCRITYQTGGGSGGRYNQPPSHIDVVETAAAVSSAAGNTGIVPLVGKEARYINGDLVDVVLHSVQTSGAFEVLYDSKLTEFEKLIASSGSSFLSLGSGWA